MNIAELLPLTDGKLAKLQQARKLISDSDPASAVPAVGKRRGRPPGSGTSPSEVGGEEDDERSGQSSYRSRAEEALGKGPKRSKRRLTSDCSVTT